MTNPKPANPNSLREIVKGYFPDVQARALLAPVIAGKGQRQIAADACVTQATISQFLGGKAVGLETRLRLALACGYSVSITITPPA